MSRIWMPGGAGSTDLDVVTAGAGDVLNGKVIVDRDGNPLAGTLTLSGDAGDSMVLAGKTYYNTDPKQRRTGTMVNQGTKTAALNCGGAYTIPAGYHNGQGKVTANSLASQTGVQSGKSAAGAGQVLAGYEAWVNGGRVTGTMANQGAKTAALNCGGSYTIPAGYHNGQGRVTANSLASQTDSNAAAGDIRKNKTAWVKGSKVTGNMAERAATTITPGTANQTIAANQFLTGVQTIKGDSNLVGDNVLYGKSIFGINGKVRKYASITGTADTKGSKTFTFWNYSSSKRSCYYLEIPTGFTPLAGWFRAGIGTNPPYTYNTFYEGIYGQYCLDFNNGDGLVRNSDGGSQADTNKMIVPVKAAGTYIYGIVGYY